MKDIWWWWRLSFFNLWGNCYLSLGTNKSHGHSNSNRLSGSLLPFSVWNATLTILVGHQTRTPLLESTAMNRMIDGCDSFLLSCNLFLAAAQRLYRASVLSQSFGINWGSIHTAVTWWLVDFVTTWTQKGQHLVPTTLRHAVRSTDLNVTVLLVFAAHRSQETLRIT